MFQMIFYLTKLSSLLKSVTEAHGMEGQTFHNFSGKDNHH